MATEEIDFVLHLPRRYIVDLQQWLGHRFCPSFCPVECTVDGRTPFLMQNESLTRPCEIDIYCYFLLAMTGPNGMLAQLPTRSHVIVKRHLILPHVEQFPHPAGMGSCSIWGGCLSLVLPPPFWHPVTLAVRGHAGMQPQGRKRCQVQTATKLHGPRAQPQKLPSRPAPSGLPATRAMKLLAGLTCPLLRGYKYQANFF
jgi:hypothetical protein